jgi:CRP-like cAMP-binding protein
MPSRLRQNHLLARLSADDAALLVPHVEPVELTFRLQLETPNRPITHVYFPADGIVSVVASGAHEQIEVGIVGRDGMTGHAILLGSDRSPIAMYMQIPGHGSRVSATAMREALERSATLRLSLQTFLQSFMVQASHTALANGRAKLEARLARWLLMAHDRLDADKLSLTHEFLSVMLGVRRPGVTVALQKHEAASLIETQRNGVTVRNRAGLQALAEAIYGVPEVEQFRLTGWRSLHPS